MTDTALDAAMRQVHDDGGTVVRTWWFATYYRAGADRPWAAFDRVLAAASRHGVKVVAVLANQQADCTGRPGALTLADYRPGSPFTTALRSWAAAVATHYADDPAIAYWQLVNEPEAPSTLSPPACDEPAAAAALAAFATTMSSVVRGADPGHLVSMGTLGTGQCGTAGADYATVSGAAGIGVCEYHDYKEPTVALPDDGYNRLAQRIAQCRGLGEPIVVGEAGIDAGSPCGPDSLATRAGELGAKADAAFAAGVSGYMPWEVTTVPSCSAPADDQGHTYAIGPGDPTDQVLAAVARRLAGATPPALPSPPRRTGAPGSGSSVAPPTALAVVAAAVVAVAVAVATRRRRPRRRRRRHPSAPGPVPSGR